MITLPFKLAWGSLFVHKTRTALTVLGIVIGIASVIVVMSAGESIKGLVLGEFDSYGSDFVQIEIKIPSASKTSTSNAGGIAMGIEITTLTLDDGKAIAKLPNIREVGAGTMGQSVVSYTSENKTVNYLASSQNMPELMGVDIEYGRLYTEDEDNSLAKVVVLGSDVAADLFGNQNPVGQSVKLGKLRFKVIGVAEERGASLGLDFDAMVYLPLQTAQKLLLGVDYVTFITAKMVDANIGDETAEEINFVMRDRHEITDPKDDDFAVTTAEEALGIINSIFDGITLLLVAIAGISLLVGGVGIMNIMYVSVTERTFEIGLRKSVGAKTSQILWQFLWEAIVVTLFGGFVGVIFGTLFTFLVSFGASQAGFSWDFILPVESVIIAFVFATTVGILFGYYPAKKAASLDPIVAIRRD
jgi:putative ABC transport system permease protein